MGDGIRYRVIIENFQYDLKAKERALISVRMNGGDSSLDADLIRIRAQIEIVEKILIKLK